MNKRELLLAVLGNVITIADLEDVCRMATEYQKVHNTLLDLDINVAVTAVDMPRYWLHFASATFDRKIQAIKLVREIGGWGLREAKDIVELTQNGAFNRAPLTKAEADKIRMQFVDIDAVVVIKDEK